MEDWVLCKIYETKRGRARQDTGEAMEIENNVQDTQQITELPEVNPTQQNQHFEIQDMQLPQLQEISFDDDNNDPIMTKEWDWDELAELLKD